MAKRKKEDAADSAAQASADPRPFEALLDETEALVEELESGELSLEESMKKYEDGVANLRRCTTILTTARQKVQQLIESSNQELLLKDFDADEDDGREDDETD